MRRLKYLPLVIALVAGACALAEPLEAAQGVLIVEKTPTDGKSQVNQIQVEKDHMRAETIGPGGEKQAVIFDGPRQVLWIVNLDKRTYGIGVRMHTGRATIARLDVAHGADGWRIVVRTNDPLHLSRLSRRTAAAPFVP